jgi:ATPase subunit of ABC transporter with duplicated ATPase domains
MVFVSHDSYFIERIATEFSIYPRWTEFLRRATTSFLMEAWREGTGGFPRREQQNAVRTVPRSGETESGDIQNAAEARKEANRRRNRRKSLQQQADSLLEEAEDIERQIAETEALMGMAENYSVSEKITALAKRKQELQQLHEAKSEQWFEITGEIEEMNANEQHDT